MGRVFAPWWASVQVLLTAASLTGYLVASWRALGSAPPPEAFGWAVRRHRWLRRLLGGITLALVVLVAFDGVGALSGDLGVGRPAWVVAVEAVVYVGVLYAGAFAGLVQADARLGSASEAPLAEARPALLPAPEADAHRAALARLVEEERPYLDPDLSLGSLADQVGVTDKTLSALLNDVMGTTYTDYVNGLRVAEAQRRLADPAHAHLSVLGVGLDSGFASKSTFNRVFKETTGQTPSAYRAASGEVAAGEGAAARPIAS